METANAYNFVKSENLTITSDNPIPNVYNTLSERNVIETEISNNRVNDPSNENSVVIKTEPIDNALIESQLITIQQSDFSENRTLQDPTGPICLPKKDATTDFSENQGNVIHQANRTIKSLQPGTAAKGKPFICEVCRKIFSKLRSLNKHKRTHTAERPFVCDVCDKRFLDSSHLVRHKRSHTGEKPFVCDFCDKRFSASGYLATHTRCHTGEKSFVCDFCDERFSASGHLATHTRCHTGEKPFVCDFCNKSFSRASNLRQHKRVHTGEKPYMCDVCYKSFAQSGTLKQHKIIHTGEKPFVCDFCDKSFSFPASLRRHKRSHSGDSPEPQNTTDRELEQHRLSVIPAVNTNDPIPRIQPITTITY